MRFLRSHKSEAIALAFAAAWFAAVLWFYPVAVLLALPWMAATAWFVARHGRSVLLTGETHAIPAQALELRAFRGAVPR